MFAAACALALPMGLSVSLVVAGPSRADAWTAGLYAELLPEVEGATVAIAPEALGAAVVVSGPVGWGIAAFAGIAIGAYATKDYWLPYVTGTYGQASNENGGASGSDIDTNLSIKSVVQDPGNVQTLDVTVQIQNPPSGTTQDQGYYISAYMNCNSKADGTGDSYPAYNNAMTSTYKYNFGVGLQTFTAKCQYGVPTGGVFGPAGHGEPLLTQSAGTWRGPGNIMRWGKLVTTTQAQDPHGKGTIYRSTVECISPSGLKTRLTADSTGDLNAVKMRSCEAGGYGHGTGVNSVDGIAPDGTVTRLWATTAPPPPANEPLCDPALPSTGCTMSISIDGKPCVVGDLQCENWLTIFQATPARVTCAFGPYTKDPSQCTLLKLAYFPGGAPANDPNTNSDPAARVFNDATGQPYTPPAPGSTGTGTIPGGAGQPAPAPSPAGAPGPASTSADCWPSGWGIFNPGWISDSLSCMFIPKTDIQAKGQEVSNSFSNKAPFSWMTGAGVVVAGSAAIGSGGCPNWVINVGPVHQNVVCGSSFTSAILASRPALTGLMIIAMFWPLIRSLWYAVIPILRPTPMAS